MFIYFFFSTNDSVLICFTRCFQFLSFFKKNDILIGECESGNVFLSGAKFSLFYFFVVVVLVAVTVKLLTRVQLCDSVDCSCQVPLLFTISLSLPKFMSISSCDSPFSPCLQSFTASEFFPVSWLFESSGQRFEASDSASVLPVTIQCWFSLGVTGLISLKSRKLSRVFSSTTILFLEKYIMNFIVSI